MDGTIRFPLLLSIGINCYFLLSDRLLIHHHALKWKVLNQIFLLLSGPPPKHTKRQRRNSARQMKKKWAGTKLRMSKLTWFLVVRRFLELNTKVYVGNTPRNQCFLLMGKRFSDFFWPRPNDRHNFHFLLRRPFPPYFLMDYNIASSNRDLTRSLTNWSSMYEV